MVIITFVLLMASGQKLQYRDARSHADTGSKKRSELPPCPSPGPIKQPL